MLYNVEVKHCSQRDTFKAAVRFEDAGYTPYPSATNPSPEPEPSILYKCAIHSGLGHGIYILNSHSVWVQQTTVFNFTVVGINIGASKNILIEGNMVGHITARSPGVAADKMAGVATCSIPEKTECSGIEMVDNIVAGAQWVGFTALAHKCGEADTQRVFRNNTAHSVSYLNGRYPEAGHGAIVIPNEWDEDQKGPNGCSEASHITAYRNQQGVAVGFTLGPKRIIVRDVSVVDNVLGFVAAPAWNDKNNGPNSKPVNDVRGEYYNIVISAYI